MKEFWGPSQLINEFTFILFFSVINIHFIANQLRASQAG